MHIFYLDILLSQLSVRGEEILKSSSPARVGIRHPRSETCWGASNSQGACVICPYAPSLHNRLMPKQSSSNVFSAPSSRPAICKQSKFALFSHTTNAGFSSKHKLPIQTWSASTELKIFCALRKPGWESGTEFFNNLSALRVKTRQ